MSKVQFQPGFLPPGDDIMALVSEVGDTLRSILKSEEDVGTALRKSDGGEHVATSDAQTIKEGGAKGSGEHVATSDAQTLKAEGSMSAERSGAETTSSGGKRLPVKPSGMKKGSPSASESSSSSSMAKGSPSASESSMSKGSPSYSASESSMCKGSPSEGSSPSASAGIPEGSASSASEGSAMPPGDGSPSADDGAPPEGAPAEGAPAEGMPGQEGAAGPSFEELVQMLSQLSPEDLQAHIAAAEQAQQMQSGGGNPGGMPPAGPPAGGMPPSAPPSAGPSAMPPMGKSEKDGVYAELKKTQDQLAAVAEAVTALVTMPKRKSINGLTFIPYQGGEMKKSEPARPSFKELKKNSAALHAELKAMTMPDSKLEKKERDMITDFYCRRISVDELAPIFDAKK